MKLQKKSPGGGWILFFILVALLIIGFAVALWQWEHIVSRLCTQALEQERTECQKRIETALVTEKPTPPAEGTQEAVPESTPQPPESSPAEVNWIETTGAFPTWPGDFASPEDCQAVREDLLTICHQLDSRPYLQSRAFEEGSFDLIQEVVGALANNPPVASGEMLRYESITANVFHIFRTLGKNRTSMLLEILAREQAVAEPMAMALFRWLLANQKCGDEAGPMSFQTLYDYATYFLNTLGGQAYVYRRTPRVSALTSFYALVILDQAIQKDINPHGVDPRPHIRQCRDLLALQDLVFRDHYLEILREIEQHWESF